MKNLMLALTSCASLTLAACGGTSTVFDPPIETLALGDDAASGYVYASGTVIDAPGGTAIRVGDNGADLARRGIVRFTLPAIPPGADIVAAELQLEQYKVDTSPFAALGDVLVDHVALGPTLDGADYAAPALASAIGVLSASSALGIRSMNVRARVAADLNAGRSTTDFRLRFPVDTDNDGTTDTVHFNDAEDDAGSGNVPRLIIRYKLP